MNRPQEAPVSCLLPHLGRLLKELGKRHVMKDLFSKDCGSGAHLSGHSRVIIRQIRMRSFGICDAQAVAVLLQVTGNAFDLRILLVREINMYQISHRACRLIHQAAGFSEIHVLRILADDGDIHRGNLHIIVKAGKNRSDNRLEGR